MPLITPTFAHLTPYGHELFAPLREEILADIAEFEERASLRGSIAGAASFSNAYEVKVLEHIAAGKTALTAPANYLALTTVVPDDTLTGTTITEAGYTGYARKQVLAADYAAAVSGAPGSIANANVLTFAACTAGTSTIIGFAVCDALTVGGVIMWGTCTSTVISTTQTPATVAVGALSMTLD